MRKLCIIAVLLSLIGSSVFASTVTIPASQACRTRSDTGTPPGSASNVDSSKLTVRAVDYGQKSWIRFNNLGSYYLPGLRAATLTLTVMEAQDSATSSDISAVNDDYLDNIDWTESSLTWNNAPGNDTTSLGALDAAKTTYLATLNIPSLTPAGVSFNVNVLAAIQADMNGTAKDGIVQFVLHNSPTNLNFATWDHATVEWRPYLTLEYTPAGADYPNPAVGTTVTTSLPALSWTLPEPNVPGTPIYCDVYLGTDPNRPDMDKVTLANGVKTVDINTTNFPRFGTLADKTTYYWFVDIHDASRLPNPVPGEEWSFSTYNNVAPVVDAGADQITWGLPKTITLDATVTDDDLPTPPALTYVWTRVAGPASAVINSPNTEDTSIEISERGDYQFRLTVNDGERSTYDQVQVVVGTDACDASHIDTGAAYNAADANKDCLVDISDLKSLIIDNWLKCTDVLENCGN